MANYFPLIVLVTLIFSVVFIIFPTYVTKQFRRIPVEGYILIPGLLLMNLIFLWTPHREQLLNKDNTGQLGDFVGGYVGTFFALVSVLLLFRTLTNQRRLSAVTSFETKFYELIKLHRDNVTEMHVDDVQGRRIFVLMIAELRFAFSVVQIVGAGQNLTVEEKWHIAYYFFFFGVGKTSTPMVEHALSDYPKELINLINDHLSRIRQEQREIRSNSLRTNTFNSQPYVRFDGHQSRLGHYYRHLYQSIWYVDKHSPGEKYEYIKMIRAQLSTHEQALLLINSLTPFGRNWWDDGFMRKYKMVKNLPPGFFNKDTEINITRYFEPGYFEVDELQKRPISRVLR